MFREMEVPLVLDARSSYDPDEAPLGQGNTGLLYAWSCEVASTGDDCLAGTTYPFDQATLTFDASAVNPLLVYDFTLTVPCLHHQLSFVIFIVVSLFVLREYLLAIFSLYRFIHQSICSICPSTLL